MEACQQIRWGWDCSWLETYWSVCGRGLVSKSQTTRHVFLLLPVVRIARTLGTDDVIVTVCKELRYTP